jgi:ATP-dependent exoDNAse (exonuclease V) beta subunit
MVRSALAGLSDGSIEPPCPKLLVVDEYQDTSLTQDKFLEALDAKRIIRVGDVKQAIYGFRGGTSELLKERIANAGDGAFRLPKNFRSAAPIVDMANAFVKEVWPAIDPSAAYLEAGQITGGADKGDCPVGIVLTEGPSRGTNLPALSGWIAALSQESGWVRLFGRTCEAPTRALLLRQRTKLPALLLNLRHKGIQPYVLAREGFWDSPGVRLTMAALEAVAYPSRPLPCAVLLRHLVPLTDMELHQAGAVKGLSSLDIEAFPIEKRPRIAWLQALRRASTQQIAASLLAQGGLLAIVASTDAHGAMEPERARRNLAGFLAALQDLPSNPATAYALLDELRNGPSMGDLPSADQNASLIIQTVHASKGLEYDYVILPLLNHQRKGIRAGHILTDPENKSLLIAWKFGSRKGDSFNRIAELVEGLENIDNLNLFCVAISSENTRM